MCVCVRVYNEKKRVDSLLYLSSVSAKKLPYRRRLASQQSTIKTARSARGLRLTRVAVGLSSPLPRHTARVTDAHLERHPPRLFRPIPAAISGVRTLPFRLRFLSDFPGQPESPVSGASVLILWITIWI
jgi:hypothetical protein